MRPDQRVDDWCLRLATGLAMPAAELNPMQRLDALLRVCPADDFCSQAGRGWASRHGHCSGAGADCGDRTFLCSHSVVVFLRSSCGG